MNNTTVKRKGRPGDVERQVGTRAAKTKVKVKDWSVLSDLPRDELSALLGPTIDEIIAEEFDAKTLAEIHVRAAAKAERIKSFMRAEATAKSAALGVLRTMRKTAGITQKEMAKRLDISPPAISKMESADPQMSSVLLYAEALGNSLSLMISGPKGEAVVPFEVNPLETSSHRKPLPA